MLIAIAIAFLLAIIDQALNHPAFSIYRVMSAESYFCGGQLPWLGLLVSVALSASLCYAAVVNISRRDF